MRELVPLLTGAGLVVDTLVDAGIEQTADEEALEEFDTFEDNALAKARWFSARSNGRVVLADDSGLAVGALDGRPGVRSKRWAGSLLADGPLLDEANSNHLLRELTDAALAGRTGREAQFVCAAACVWPGASVVAVGSTAGRVLEAPTGRGGFGYDPLFWSHDLHASFGEASTELKASVSHRARAFALLIARLRAEKSLAAKLFRPVDPDGMPG